MTEALCLKTHQPSQVLDLSLNSWFIVTAITSMAASYPYLLYSLSFLFFLVSASEMEVLLNFKNSIDDPMDTLSSWKNSSLNNNICNWTGIHCNTASSYSSSVISVNLQGFNLSGEFSSSICELPNLSELNLASNFFNQPIPLQLFQCDRLKTLNLSNNLIWGTLPEDELPLFSSLEVLDLSKNHLQGLVPRSLGSLENLMVLNLAHNSFTGKIPSIFQNLTELLILDLSENPFLLSEIPLDIGGLYKLELLYLQKSNFYGEIPVSLQNLTGLVVLDLSQNNLTGAIPLGFGFGSKLLFLDFSQNKLSGTVPSSLCHGNGLLNLGLHSNFFSGLIPDSLEKCLTLERFQVQNNGFSGDFPSGLWSLPNLKLVRAENNRFSGNIPNSISMAAQLEQVQIDNNSFTGIIPLGIGKISTLYRFSATHNGFFGNLPENFCNSPVMSIINLSHNLLSGRIPELRTCKRLVSISLADNSFTGEIPTSLAALPVLTYIDLSSNNLTGEIPSELQNLKLALFNVSFNQLSGRVPFSLISGLPASFLQGNPDLCGPGLPKSCVNATPDRPARPIGLICALVSIAVVVGIVIFAIGFIAVRRSSRQNSCSDTWKSLFFYPLRVTEQDLLMGLDDKNRLGTGVFGEVFKFQLPGGEFVAVKKLWKSGGLSSKSLKNEIKNLAKIRHKNIAKLLGFCYSEDLILLVYEYLERGSLWDEICRSDFSFPWGVRLRIAVGAAQGLAHLHSENITHLLHRNIKSKNVLLDMNFEPKLADFGLDRIVGESVYRSSMASDLSSYCYLAPENSYTKKATEQMDVYSYGVVLLELITGWKTELPESGDDIDVVKWVRRKINTKNRALEVLDPKVSKLYEQQMLGALEIALSCTTVLPEKRPTMPEVVRLLQSLDSFSGKI